MRRRLRTLALGAAGLIGLTLVAPALVGPTASASPTGFDAVKTYTSQPTSVVAPADGEAWVSSPAGDNTALDHYVGGTWTHSELTGISNGRLKAGAPNDVWLYGGAALRHYDGSSWSTVPLPAGPQGETLSIQALADAPGPDAYVGFSYFSFDSPYALVVGKWNGTSWTLLPWTFDNGQAETFDDLAYADNTVIARFESYRGLGQYLTTYTTSGGWTAPVNTGQDVSGFSWIHDWVVQGADDIWLYGEGIGDTTQVARCAHFDGTAVTEGSCVAGSGGPVYASTAMPDGRHLVGSSGFDLLRQPDQQTLVGSVGVTRVLDLAAEPSSGVAWALAQRANDFALLRYGVASDTSQFVVTAQASRSQVETGDVVTITGTVAPQVAAGADRRVVLQTRTADGWTRVVADRTAADGSFRFDVQTSATGTVRYRVFKPAVGPIAGAYSPVVSVSVIAPFTVTINAPTQVRAGTKAVITGKVTPAVTDPSQRGVQLQVKSGTTWRTLTTTSTNATGGYRFEPVLTTTGCFRYRVVKTAAEGRTERASAARTFIVVA